MSNLDGGGAHQDFVAPPTVLFTHDEARVEHIISDETLMQIAYGGQDRSFEIAVGALGVAAGYFQNFATVIAKMQGGEALPSWDAIGSLIFIVAATVAIICLITYRRKGTKMDDVVAKIRSRKAGRMADPGKPYVAGEPVAPVASMEQVSASTTE